MKNKKGFLLAEETLKIVIAVICIGFLVYFLTALYFAKINNEKLRYAKAILEDSEESIKTVIERVRLGRNEELLFQLKNPKGWYLVGFIDKPKPNSCLDQSCLCICEGVSSLSPYKFTQGDQERQANKCNKKGTCLIVSDLKEEKLKIEIKQQFILIKKVNDKIEIKEK